MKWYSYIILTAICELLSVSSVYNYSDNTAELVRIVYLEKTALREFSFDPFPLFVMLCYLTNIIAAVIFITSNIPENELIITRFNSYGRFFGYRIKKLAEKTLISSAVMTIAPVLFIAAIRGFSDIICVTAAYFARQFVLLYFSSGISLILRKRLNSGAAVITAGMLTVVFILTDVFMDNRAALIDLSLHSLAATVCEAAACAVGTVCCRELFKRKKELY